MPDKLHCHLLKEQVEVILGLLTVTFENSWRTGEELENRRSVNTASLSESSKKDGPGICRVADLIFMPVLEQGCQASSMQGI